MSDVPLPVEALVEQRACCGNGCQKCPYLTKSGYRHFKGNTTIDNNWVQASKANPELTWREYQRNEKEENSSC
jgi:hypothetical protein